MPRPKFNPDRLIHTDQTRVGKAVFKAVNAFQSLPAEEQLAASAILLQLMSRQFNAHLGTVLEVANNVIDRTIHACPELGASIDYVREEL